MIARRASLIALVLLALAPASAAASRKLSLTHLKVPSSAHAGDPLPISGTVRNGGDEQAQVTIRPYLIGQFGRMRVGGHQVPVGAEKNRAFSMAPVLSYGTAGGDYQLAVCVRRLNRHGPARCKRSPITIEGNFTTPIT